MADYMQKQHSSRTTTWLEAAVWAGKMLFQLIGIASTTVLTARFAFPYLLSLASLSLPKLENSVIPWLAPPYLFISVHIIIMVIWKLHGKQGSEDAVVDDDDNSSVSDSTVVPADLSIKPVSNDAHAEIISTVHVTPYDPDTSVENPSELEPKLPHYTQTFTTEDTIIDNARSTEQRPWPLPPQPVTAPEEMEEDMDYSASTDPDSLDATWKAIMDGKFSPVRTQHKMGDTLEKASHAQAKQATVPATLTRVVAVDVREFKKSDTFREAASTVSVEEGTAVLKKEMRKSKTFRESKAAATATMGWRGRDVLVVCREELFRKVEAFIKMNYDQMRLQRQESEQRCVEMANLLASSVIEG